MIKGTLAAILLAAAMPAFGQSQLLCLCDHEGGTKVDRCRATWGQIGLQPPEQTPWPGSMGYMPRKYYENWEGPYADFIAGRGNAVEEEWPEAGRAVVRFGLLPDADLNAEVDVYYIEHSLAKIYPPPPPTIHHVGTASCMSGFPE